MSKKIAILQSNYIPWIGYFDIINKADIFVFYDDVQYTKNDWRNRNKIKTNNGLQWLTVPVKSNKLSQRINEVEILNQNWHKKHLNAIKTNYAKSKNFQKTYPFIKELYEKSSSLNKLIDINRLFIIEISDFLNINTEFKCSSEFNLSKSKTQRLIDICKKCDGSEYISGPAAKSYLDIKLFEKENIKLTFMDYNDYKEYNQLFGAFEIGVSILDILFNEGSNASNYIDI